MGDPPSVRHDERLSTGEVLLSPSHQQHIHLFSNASHGRPDLHWFKRGVDSLKGSVAELEKKLRTLEVDGSRKIMQEMFNHLKSKLENIISPNNLKKNANWGT
jgi:hypothetical protein